MNLLFIDYLSQFVFDDHKLNDSVYKYIIFIRNYHFKKLK